MGVLIKWKRPSSDTTYTDAYIYRSDSETGTFSELDSQDIADNNYYDYNGVGSYWYKVRFYDSVNAVYSEYSVAKQGTAIIGYVDVDEVRAMTNITANQISDTQLALLIEMASAQLNSDISIKHEDELVEYIDSVKTNYVDGTTLTFYTQHYPVGDRNNSFTGTTADIYAYVIDANDQKQDRTVTSLDNETGKFVLSQAPLATDTFYITYYSTNVLISPPHRLVKLATIWLTAAFAYSKINVGKAPRFKEGSLTVFRDTTAHKEYMNRYYEVIYKINKMVDSKEHELLL